jgi:hypothetical protein
MKGVVALDANTIGDAIGDLLGSHRYVRERLTSFSAGAHNAVLIGLAAGFNLAGRLTSSHLSSKGGIFLMPSHFSGTKTNLPLESKSLKYPSSLSYEMTHASLEDPHTL